MTIDERPGQASSLLNYLPAIFLEGGESGQSNFLGRFLLAFERILLGLGEVSQEVPQPGLEEILGGKEIVDPDGIIDPDRVFPPNTPRRMKLSGIQRYFESGVVAQPNGDQKLLEPPERAPTEFLRWLAGFVALTLREDWDELRQRELIANAVRLYRLRGTKRGLEEFLRIYTRLGVEVDELNTPFQIGVHSTVGKDTILGGGTPFFFKVRIFLPTPDPVLIKQQREIAKAIVDLQKPAHTYYDNFLSADSIVTPTFQIGKYSTVGVDTLLG